MLIVLALIRLSNLESENLELNQQVGELGRALGQEAAAYQAQVLMLVIVVMVMLPSISMWSDASGSLEVVFTTVLMMMLMLISMFASIKCC